MAISGSEAGLSKDRVLELLKRVRPIFEGESSLVRVKAESVVFVGDTHGDLESTMYVFNRFDPRHYTLIFLGDYVDRGPRQLRNIVFLFERKLEFPGSVILLRGNHETMEINRVYGFLNELIGLYRDDGVAVWRRFNEVFSLMPYGCLVNKRILALHGGLASGLIALKQIEQLPKGETDPTDPVAFQILWNDPKEGIKGFSPSSREGGILYYGRDVVENFEKKNKVSLIIRSHEPIPEGAKYLFATETKNKSMLKRIFGKANEYPGLLLSIFTSRYCVGCKPAIAVLDRGRIKIEFLTGGEACLP
jgi:diadenosine tetraphosphatase ApaH/serine/threonine PP2A family protein phosphatase